MVSRQRILSIFLSLIFIFLAFFVFASFIKPVYHETQNLRAEIINKEEYIKRQKEIIDQIQGLMQEYANQEKLQESISLALPLSPSVGEALIQIGGILDANYLLPNSLNLSGSLNVNFDSSDNNLSSNSFGFKPAGVFDINLKIYGTYENFKNFLNQIQNNIRLFEIKTLSINKTTIQSGNQKNLVDQKKLIFDMVISAFYQVEN